MEQHCLSMGIIYIKFKSMNKHKNNTANVLQYVKETFIMEGLLTH